MDTIIVDINDNGKYEGLMGLDTEKKILHWVEKWTYW